MAPVQNWSVAENHFCSNVLLMVGTFDVAHCFPQASKGKPDLVSLLLQRGADANAKDRTGSTALHRAASAGVCLPKYWQASD